MMVNRPKQVLLTIIMLVLLELHKIYQTNDSDILLDLDAQCNSVKYLCCDILMVFVHFEPTSWKWQSFWNYDARNKQRRSLKTVSFYTCIILLNNCPMLFRGLSFLYLIFISFNSKQRWENQLHSTLLRAKKQTEKKNLCQIFKWG